MSKTKAIRKTVRAFLKGDSKATQQIKILSRTHPKLTEQISLEEAIKASIDHPEQINFWRKSQPEMTEKILNQYRG